MLLSLIIDLPNHGIFVANHFLISSSFNFSNDSGFIPVPNCINWPSISKNGIGWAGLYVSRIFLSIFSNNSFAFEYLSAISFPRNSTNELSYLKWEKSKVAIFRNYSLVLALWFSINSFHSPNFLNPQLLFIFLQYNMDRNQHLRKILIFTAISF